MKSNKNTQFSKSELRYTRGVNAKNNDQLWKEFSKNGSGIWFHSEGLSSAHIYVHRPENPFTGLTDIPEDVVRKCSMDVAKSSQNKAGCKGVVKVVVTTSDNLAKQAGFAEGTLQIVDRSYTMEVTVNLHSAKVDITKPAPIRDQEEAKQETASKPSTKAKQNKKQCEGKSVSFEQALAEMEEAAKKAGAYNNDPEDFF